MKNTPHLSEQVILITGASAGIGAAVALMLAHQFDGIRLVLVARRVDKLEQVAEKCRQAQADVLVVATDMSDEKQVKRLADNALTHFGRVDAVVNNAGYGQMAPLELVTSEMAQRQFAVNFHSVLILTQALIPVMRDQGGGRIINISSVGGKMAFPAGGLYSASKFALEALSDVLRMELQGFNIRVSVIEPGPVVTEFFRVAWEEVQKSVPDFDKSVYYPAFAKIEAIEQQLSSLGWAPEKVAKIILKALRAPHPRPRYLAATGGRIFVPMMSKWLPTWFTDAFWRRFYGLDEVDQQWQKVKRGL